MRTYEFQGKRLDTGEWVYGGIYQHHERVWIITGYGQIMPFEVDPATVGQSTASNSQARQSTAELEEMRAEIEDLKIANQNGCFIMDAKDKRIEELEDKLAKQITLCPKDQKGTGSGGSSTDVIGVDGGKVTVATRSAEQQEDGDG